MNRAITTSSSATQVLLEVRDLKTYFETEHGTVKAVDGISFTIERGGILGVVGESGSGKSVTGLSVLRLLGSRTARIAGGQILWKGQDLLAKSEREMQCIRGSEISMIFQNAMTALDPFFKVGDQLTEIIMLHQGVGKVQARLKAREVLELVKIPEAARRLQNYPHQMSGGQRQRVMIALALSCNPDLIIADEPTTALDATVQKQIVELLAEINDELGTAIMMITHDMGVVAHLCKTVAVTYQGHVVETGTVKEVLENPQAQYTQNLLSAVLRMKPVEGAHSVRS